MDAKRAEDQTFYDFLSLLHRLRERCFWGNLTLHFSDGQLRRVNLSESNRVEDLGARLKLDA